jgi:hypothetical protein
MPPRLGSGFPESGIGGVDDEVRGVMGLLFASFWVRIV